MNEFKVGDRVVIVSFSEGFRYGSGFKENVRLNQDAGIVFSGYDKFNVNVMFDRDFQGLWGKRAQTLPKDTIVLERNRLQEITGKVMVIGEL